MSTRNLRIVYKIILIKRVLFQEEMLMFHTRIFIEDRKN